MDSKLFGKKNGILTIIVVAVIGTSVFFLQDGEAQYNTYTGPPKSSNNWSALWRNAKH